MSEETPNLGLPYIMPSQAQKHVTHNEAIRALDALLQIGVIARDLDEPPADPQEGDRYIVAEGATESWAGKDGWLAAFQDGDWAFYQPKAGWIAFVGSENALVVHDGETWQAMPLQLAAEQLQMVDGLGINASYDATNRLAVSSPFSLFNHEGAGHQVKINKNQASDTASVLFQTNWSGRAEFGTTGDDNFHVKVSANGSSWTEAIRINCSNGAVAIGGINPAQKLHVRGGRMRLEHDDSPAGIQIHRYQSGNYGAAPWKGFLIAVEASSSGNGRLVIGDYGSQVTGTATPRLAVENDGSIAPGADDAQSLGTATSRWAQIFAASATISTSDENEKQDIGPVPDEWLDAWGDVEWVRYRARDAVQAKGNVARWHVGLVAQRVRDCFAARGLDAFELGLLCYDECETEEDGGSGPSSDRPQRRAGRYGIRYEEALALEAAWQRRELRRIMVRFQPDE